MSKTKEDITIQQEAGAAIDSCRRWLGEVAGRFESQYAELDGHYFLEFLGSEGESVTVKRMISTHSRAPLYTLAYSGGVPDLAHECGPVTAILMPAAERQQSVWAARTELDATLGTFIVGYLQQENLQPVGYVATGNADQPVKMVGYPAVSEAAF